MIEGTESELLLGQNESENLRSESRAKGRGVSSAAKVNDAELASSLDGSLPTEHEKETLRRVADSVSLAAWLVCVVEFAERFTFYALAGPLQNYMQNPYGNPLRPGALGLGQANASTISCAFTFWMYLTPLFGGIIADGFLGRYRTICYASAIYVVGLLILFLSSLPISLENGGGLPGLLVALFLIGSGAGGIKANVGVLIFEQYTETKQKIKTLESGERVIVDPQATISNLLMIFTNLLCIGCLSGIPATYIELHVGFWAAYLMSFCVYWVALAALFLGRNLYIQATPEPVLPQAFKAFSIAMKNGGNLDAARPSLYEGDSIKEITWDDKFVDELKRLSYGCKVLIPLPIAWLCYLQATNNLVSQAGTMETHGIPNDILYNFQMLVEIVLIHVMRTIIYPLFAKHRIQCGPMRRMTAGFLCGVLAIGWAAVVQKIIYSAGPCYDAPLACHASEGGAIPNRVHIALQLPSYILFALSEALFAITSSEYAYTKAPKSMKSVVAAINLLTVAVASAIGLAVNRAASDPHLITMYASLAVVYFIVTVLFWWVCHGYDDLEDELFDLDHDEYEEISQGDEDS